MRFMKTVVVNALRFLEGTVALVTRRAYGSLAADVRDPWTQNVR